MEIAIAFYKTREQHTTVNILADALHNVMANDELKTACFDYLFEGGKKAEEPIALLIRIRKKEKGLSQTFFFGGNSRRC
jgi:hypothetical protein